MTNNFPVDPNKLLRRMALAEALTAAGYPIATATLATKACRGGGPPFQMFGRLPIYTWGTSLSWAKARLGPASRSTSEARAHGKSCQRGAAILKTNFEAGASP